MNKKLISFIPKLILFSLVAGVLAGVLELYLGHGFILNPLLYDKDQNFVYESYFSPTYYGMTKSLVVAIAFFLVFLFTRKTNLKIIFKAIIVGILGTTIFGIYYYFTFPRVTSSASSLIGVVHFSFIAGTSYFCALIMRRICGKK